MGTIMIMVGRRAASVNGAQHVQISSRNALAPALAPAPVSEQLSQTAPNFSSFSL